MEVLYGTTWFVLFFPNNWLLSSSGCSFDSSLINCISFLVLGFMAALTVSCLSWYC